LIPISVPISRPDLGDDELAALARVVRSGWIMQGPEVAAFERELAAYVGAAHAIACANGTVALELALRALGIGPGDEVATVAHSFIASASSIACVGATPVFVDVEEDTLGMDPRSLAAALGPKTRAVFCVHQLGIPCDLGGILAAAGDLPVVEDAACAIGSELGGEKLGRPRGRIATLSFHPRKVLTTGEGGMLTTSDEALAARLRRLRAHGLGPDGAFHEAAGNARLSDLHAAIGRVQLGKLPAAVAERRRLAARYDEALAGHPVLVPLPVRPGAVSNVQSYPAHLRRGTAADVLAHFAARGVGARPGLANAHETPAFRALLASGGARIGPGGLAVSERLARETVLLPLFHGMSRAEEDTVLAAIHSLGKSLG
jgi:dTDP-4-amino-4,6-dideoxygalactose transaminase